MAAAKVWLIGSGEMARAYGKVLLAQGIDFTVIGRGQASAKTFEEEIRRPVIAGGLSAFLKARPAIPSAVIVAVQADLLKGLVLELIRFGVKKILVEKPGGLNSNQIKELAQASDHHKVNLFIAYNRRFYASVLKLKELVKEEKILSFNFEFTEWSHLIKDQQIDSSIKENWFLASSSHLVDLAFYLGGKPKEISCYSSGGLDWHQRSSIFAGSGISGQGALFSYSANWESAGRWGIEILTNKHKFILRPLEELQVQEIGSLKIEKVEIDGSLDQQFKPGLYRQVENFLLEDKSNKSHQSQLCTISEQAGNVLVYDKMAGYD